MMGPKPTDWRAAMKFTPEPIYPSGFGFPTRGPGGGWMMAPLSPPSPAPMTQAPRPQAAPAMPQPPLGLPIFDPYNTGMVNDPTIRRAIMNLSGGAPLGFGAGY